MEPFSITTFLDLIFSGIAAAFGNFVEETILAAAQVIIDAILGVTPTIS